MQEKKNLAWKNVGLDSRGAAELLKAPRPPQLVPLSKRPGSLYRTDNFDQKKPRNAWPQLFLFKNMELFHKEAESGHDVLETHLFKKPSNYILIYSSGSVILNECENSKYLSCSPFFLNLNK